MKKSVAMVLALAMVVAMAACGKNSTSSSSSGSSAAPTAAGKVYFLNFKPEVAEVYDAIAAEYERETGVKVQVVTAASGTYEQTLKSEIAKTDAPTIFQMNGPVGYQIWKDYCADLKDTKLYSHLTDKSMAITAGDKVYGIPYAVEGYGIIYNKAILDKYFALPGAKAKSMDEVRNFATLKAVVEDMTAKKAQLGIEGVFASTSMSEGNQWRWQTHLANLPLHYEFAENKEFESTTLAGLAATEVTFKYAPNFKNTLDLYLNNSVTKATLLTGKSVSDSMAEFALGKAAMVQNGNWAWNDIAKVEGNTVKAEDVKFLPIYTGMPGEEKQGLCVGTENYFAINAKASPENQKASADFLYWLFSSASGKAYVKDKLGFIAPFDTIAEDEKPADPLAKEVLNWMSQEGITSVPWTFAAFPSEEFKNSFGAALAEYSNGTKDWAYVTKTMTEAWKSEVAAKPVA